MQYSQKEIKEIESQAASSISAKKKTKRDLLMEHFSGYVEKLPITDGIVCLQIDYKSGGVHVDFSIPNIRLFEISSDGYDLLELGGALAAAGVLKRIVSLTLVLDFDDNSILLDHKHHTLLQSIDYVEETDPS